MNFTSINNTRELTETAIEWIAGPIILVCSLVAVPILRALVRRYYEATGDELDKGLTLRLDKQGIAIQKPKKESEGHL